MEGTRNDQNEVLKSKHDKTQLRSFELVTTETIKQKGKTKLFPHKMVTIIKKAKDCFFSINIDKLH